MVRPAALRFSAFVVAALLAVPAFAQTRPAARTAARPAAAAATATYALDKAHSEVLFSVRHLGISTVTGRFNDADATISMTPGRLATLRTTATMQAASVSTNNERRDGHLRSADFFDVERYPTLTFQSTRVQNVRGQTFQLIGNLTMHGVTRPVTLAAEYLGATRDGEGKEHVGFTATGTINREDFGMTWNRAIEAGGVVVSKEVRLTLNLQAIRQDAPDATGSN